MYNFPRNHWILNATTDQARAVSRSETQFGENFSVNSSLGQQLFSLLPQLRAGCRRALSYLRNSQ